LRRFSSLLSADILQLPNAGVAVSLVGVNTFSQRLGGRVREFGPLCVGIDPASSTLAACGLADSADGALDFGRRVLEAADFRLSVVKPQAAFFERFGSAGWAALEHLIALARRNGVLVLLDGKRGDIDTTGEAYGEAFFRPDSPVRADAITVHAYLGFDALGRMLSLGLKHGCGTFVVVRSSNPEGRGLQLARLPDGSTVAGDLCRSITRYNEAAVPEGLGPVGAVVGATCEDAGATADALPRSFILAPGVGAQGATFGDVASRMPSARGRVLPSVSRAILSDGVSREAIGSVIRRFSEEARRASGA
jgi:orotidine-5'-phosphate decarboxylase